MSRQGNNWNGPHNKNVYFPNENAAFRILNVLSKMNKTWISKL